MKSRFVALLFAIAVLLHHAPSALGHFLWIINDKGTVQVYFSEAAEPGEPEILAKASPAKVFATSKNLRNKELSEIAITLADGQLAGKLPENAGILGLSQDYGVMTRGEDTFLLRYFGKAYADSIPSEWKELNSPERLALEITPKWAGTELQLKVIWKGQPLKDAEMNISGCGLEHQVIKTNEAGVAVCKPTADGTLSARTKFEEKGEGERDGKLFTLIRNYSTLSLPLTMPKTTAVSHHLPDIEKGITSFGGAIVGDELYIYGGHFGAAHHYSTEGQSNEFKRVSLKSQSPSWEALPEGPKLTGLALVPHHGKLYRVGGFMAKNSGDDSEPDLHSQTSFAVYDPAVKAWKDLAPLPEGRSSHDAAVLDGKLYVIGGWKLAGEEATQWHKTALVCDLTQEDPTWEPIPAPSFKRRALSVAAFGGKIYAIGGMQDEGGPSTRVDCYDPATKEWSVAPSIHGSGMEGFGTSAFAAPAGLIVTTMSGSIQRLAADGKSWELVGQLQSPRFFHRQLTTADGSVIVVGGASMESGKINSSEMFKIAD